MPACKLLFLLIPGIVLADLTDLPPALLFLAPSTALAVLLLAWRRGAMRHAKGALLLLPPLLGLLWSESESRAPRVVPEAGERKILCEVIGGRKTPGLIPAIARSGLLKERRITLRIDQDVSSEEAFSARSLLAVDGKWEVYPWPRNPGGRDYYAGEKRRGGCALLRASGVRVIETGRPLLEPVREAIRRKAARLGGVEEGLFLAFFAAERGKLDPELREAFRRTGLAHLLALSGLHLGIFYFVFSAPLSMIPLPRRIAPLPVLLLLWMLGAVASFPVSLLRALIMASLLTVGTALERNVKPMNLLAAAALIVLAGDPAALHDVSFRLSFSATAGILAILPLVSRLPRTFPCRYLLAPLLVSVSAQAATLPAVLHYFGMLAPFGAPATAAASPLAALCIASGSAWILLSPLHPWIDTTLECATWGSFALLQRVVHSLHARLPSAILFSAERADALALSSVLLLLLFVLRRHRRLRFVVLPLFSLPFFLLHDPLPLRITTLDIGQGSAAVIEMPGGENVVVDWGPSWGGWDAGERVVLPFLKRRGALPVDLGVVTHPDGDHMGGVLASLEAGAVDHLLDCGLARDGAMYARYDSLAPSACCWSSALRGRSIHFREGVTIDVAYAPEGSVPAGRSNAASLVLLLRYRDFSMLFTGDTTPDVERYLWRNGWVKGVTVLTAPHHGAGNGCTFPFMATARPRVTLLSAGRNNRYGHPAPAALKRIEKIGSSIYRTDRDGAVTIRTDGRRVVVSGEKPEECGESFALPRRPSGAGVSSFLLERRKEGVLR